MESMYFWPERPGLSIAAIVILSMLVLWAAREPMLQLLRSLGRNLDEGLDAASKWCKSSAEELRERVRTTLIATGALDLRGKLEREFHRIDAGFSERLKQYSALHRKLDDTLQKVEGDYQTCGDVPPEVPRWSSAVETITSMPQTGDPAVAKILERIHKSMQDAEKKALQGHRDSSSKRHKILGGMMPSIKEIRGLMARMKDSVGQALETATKVDRYMDEYEGISKKDEDAMRGLAYSANKIFIVSLIVLGVALGGAFVNFQLIALPMSELVPAGARIGGIPVSTISALVIVLMEAAAGIFLMDMLGITELFPRMGTIPASRRRLILGLAAGSLLVLASVEASLAILREMIVEADAALKMSLAGTEGALVTSASSSKIPIIGQAVLGFILPFLLAMVAIPLEALLDSSRHVIGALMAFLLSSLGNALGILRHVVGSVFNMLPNVYDAAIALPLRIERMIWRDGRGPQRETALQRQGVA